jgi:plastocyanin
MKKITTLFLSLFLFSNLFSQTTHTVNAGGYYYSPTNLTIELGDSVVWINDGGYHDVNGDINSITDQPFNNPETFDSPAIGTIGGVILGYRFTVAGTYNYDCSVGSHAANGMVGSVIVNLPTSLVIADKIDVLVYPNPTSGEFKINIPNYNGEFTSELFDVMGRSLIRTNQQKISLEAYPLGLYLLKVNYNNQVADIRIVRN